MIKAQSMTDDDCFYRRWLLPNSDGEMKVFFALIVIVSLRFLLEETAKILAGLYLRFCPSR